MNAMDEMERLARDYADAHSALVSEVMAMQDEITAAKRKRIDAIKRAVRAATQRRDALSAAIDGAPQLFSKPKTRTMHGIRFGLRKNKGKIKVLDMSDSIKRMRKLLPKVQADSFIRVRESVDLNAIGDLTVADLKRLGIEVTADTDEIVIRPVDDDVDKIVSALLAEAERMEVAA